MKEQPHVNYLRKLLEIAANRGRCLFMRCNTGGAFRDYTSKRTGAHKRYLIRFGAEGAPDFLVFTPSMTWHVEAKSTTGTHRKAQLRWKAWIGANTIEATADQDTRTRYIGAQRYITVRSHAEALDFMRLSGLMTEDEYQVNRRMV